MKTFIKVVQDIGLLVARVVLGLVLIGHGWNRFQTGISASASYLGTYGLPQPQLFAWGATVLEIVGGLLLVFGLLTPVVAAAVIAEQVVLVAWVTWHKGLWPLTNGLEQPLILIALALVFVVFGSGRAGVDNLFRRGKSSAKDDNGYTT